MPSQLWQDFCGSSYHTRWPILGSDQAINVYQETREIPGSPKQIWMYGTPGLKLETTLATSGCRGWFTQDGQTWTVYGNTLYERTASATYASRGTITDDGLPVSFVSNGLGGDQLGIVGGGQFYVLNILTNVLTTVTLPFSNPVMAIFQDGYTLINEANKPTVWFSALENMTSWNALDFFTRSNTSDNIIAIANTRDRIFTIGSKTTTLYYDSGNADNPFLPYPGTTTQVGGVTPWAVSVYNDVVRWLALSPRGEPRIVESRSDMAVKTISTPPINDFLQTCSTLADVEVLTYEQEGHPFVLWTAPSAASTFLGDLQTYGYDVLETQLRSAPIWHVRAGLNTMTGLYTRWRARGSTATGQVVLVGDYTTGDVYNLDISTYTDNGTTLKRERIAPFLSSENQWVYLDQVELGMQAGEGLSSGQGSAPVASLQISRDGGQTWINAGFATLGAMGAYVARGIWRRLGRIRLDRLVMRVSQTDPTPCAWGPGLWLNTTPGSGQL